MYNMSRRQLQKIATREKKFRNFQNIPETKAHRTINFTETMYLSLKVFCNSDIP